MNLASSMQHAGDDSHMEEKECVACMQKVRLSYFAEILNTTLLDFVTFEEWTVVSGEW